MLEGEPCAALEIGDVLGHEKTSAGTLVEQVSRGVGQLVVGSDSE